MPKDAFEYQKPTAEQQLTYDALTAMFMSVRDGILDACPDGRERALAITKLQECRMWANAAVALAD